MSELIVYVGRTMIVPVKLGIDVSGNTITSDIRTEDGTLIASWNVAFVTDGVNGELLFTMDNSVTSGITHLRGLMDIKRVVGGEPLQVFKQPLEVKFQKVVTP